MYFNFLPSIKYDVKPISYPFSESDYVVAKNFFRRYKISDTAFNSTVFYKKYAIGDQVRLDQIAEAAYGNPFYDWVVALVNNMINPLYDLPMTEAELRKHIESRYSNPYYDIHHYEIISEEEQTEKFGKVLMPEGTWVDESFYDNKKVLTAGIFPDLSSTTQNVTYNFNYTLGIDNNIVADTSGAAITTYGTGLGSTGGFVLYAPFKDGVRTNQYLLISGAAEPRYVQLAPVNTTNMTSFVLKGKFGNDQNGGEYADEPNEVLRLEYRTSDTDPWTEIGVIIDNGVVQSFDYIGEAPQDLGYGGPGRIPGVYENITTYEGNKTTPTSLRVTVVVESDGTISSITPTDRGNRFFNGTIVYVLNQDIGNGYYIDADSNNEYIPDVPLVLDILEDPVGTQYGRYDSEGFTFTLNVPPESQSTSTEFRLYQAENSGSSFDHFGIQEIIYNFTGTVTTEPEFKYVQLDADNYVVDGIRWTRNNGTWYKVTEIGYRYYDNGQIKEIAGSELSRPVTEFEYESTENEKKREIYILKPAYLERLVEDFRKAALYKKSSDFVSNRLKKTGV